MSDQLCEGISAKLLAYYDQHARDLPWRKRGGGLPDPYHVWLSEIMLQQTTVAAVRPYFAKFTQRWPTLAALAAAEDEEVMAAWAGLGYYSRARNLIACARTVMDEHDGQFPSDEKALRKLPGIGDYTAAAISAFAFGQRSVVVDANVERVVSRLFAVEEPLPKARRTIRTLMDRLTPDGRAGDFAQAMMDLGATICRARNPACETCPLAADCEALRLGRAQDFPVKPAKKERPTRDGCCWWIERGSGEAREVLLVTRPASAMLGSMRALPDDGWTARKDGDGDDPVGLEWIECGYVHHVFSHVALKLQVKKALVGTADTAGMIEGQWWPTSAIEDAGLPGLFAKAAARAMAMSDDRKETQDA